MTRGPTLTLRSRPVSVPRPNPRIDPLGSQTSTVPVIVGGPSRSLEVRLWSTRPSRSGLNQWGVKSRCDRSTCTTSRLPPVVTVSGVHYDRKLVGSASGRPVGGVMSRGVYLPHPTVMARIRREDILVAHTHPG